MHFFDCPAEIRLKIYAELLVLEEPIVFVVESGPSAPTPSSPLFLSKKYYGLCPELLRVNKKVYSEAITLLYSKNRFHFPDVFATTTYSAHITPFLHQIGAQTSLLRHIHISIPSINYFKHSEDRLYKADIENLEVLRDTCTGITTLEMSLDSRAHIMKLHIPPTTAETVDVLDRRLKDMPSLKDIIVDVQVYGILKVRPDAAERMREHGWTVQVTKRETPKESRVYIDYGIGTEDELGSRVDMYQVWQEEKKEWIEDYYTRCPC